MRKLGDSKNPPHLVAELSGLGKKVIDFKIVGDRGYAVVLKSSESGDSQPYLVCVNLAPITDPSIASETLLDKFSDVSCMSASPGLLCVGGSSPNGENIVALYSAGHHGRDPQLSPLSTWTGNAPIVDVDGQGKGMVVLEQSQLHYVNVAEPRSPGTTNTINLDGEFKSLARFKEMALVSGVQYAEENKSSSKCIAKAIVLEPAPQIVSDLSLEPMTNVLATCAQLRRFLVVGESATDRMMVSISYDKGHGVSKDQMVSLPKQSGGYTNKASAALGNKIACVASGWSGIQVMANAGPTWVPTYTYTIPRLPASGIATWGERVVIGGSDLKLYDITQPARPTLVSTAALPNSLRSIVGAGSYVLCLVKDSVSLRKMESLDAAVSTCTVAGQQICYDKISQKAFALNDQGTKSVVTRLNVYSNDVAVEKAFDIPTSFVRCTALEGHVALCALNDISVYKLTDKAELVGARHFPNLAVRDLVLQPNLVIVSAVDQKSKGFLILLSRDHKDMRILGSIDLPNDGGALAADKNRVVIVGKSSTEKDLAVVVDISSVAVPKIMAKFDAVEAASAVAINDKLAIVAGRGLEILSLS
jgi:hypothetical protein